MTARRWLTPLAGGMALLVAGSALHGSAYGHAADCAEPCSHVPVAAQLAQAGTPGRGASDELRVITDTREYCDHLSAQAGALRRRSNTPHAEAASLVREGDRLCLHGHIRPGIIRLRRAIMLLRGQAPGDGGR